MIKANAHTPDCVPSVAKEFPFELYCETVYDSHTQECAPAVLRPCYVAKDLYCVTVI